MKYKSVQEVKEKIKIIASLTTTPSRINLIRSTLYSILNQTINIDSIEINVPHIFKRTGEEYKIPTWLLHLEQNSESKIKIFRTEDYGAITKVAPTLIRHNNSKNTYVWSVDDDFEYPENMLAVLYRELIPNNKLILSHSGAFWKYSNNLEICEGYESNRREGVVEIAEGFATILYPASLIDDDFENYIIETSKNVDCRNSDDVLISNYFNLKNITIYNCAYPYKKDKILLNDTGLQYGYNVDALHRQGGGNIERYIRVYNWLISKNLNSWEKINTPNKIYEI